jgi:hypothetical protein
VLGRLQTVGTRQRDRSRPFLYDHPPTAAACARLPHIVLKPGVAASMRHLHRLQGGRCFYTGARLNLIGPTRAGEVDHFIPWARYPLDSLFNLMLASNRENQRLRDELTPAALRQRWLARNDAHLELFVAPEPGGLGRRRGIARR